MESNGKSVGKDGKEISWNSVPVVWGGVGTDGQHAFFQHLHQGTRLIPCDFLVGLTQPKTNMDGIDIEDHHMHLFSNCLAQMEALAQGTETSDPYRRMKGGKPSTCILYSMLNPSNLGAIIAIYEHKVFVQGQIWGINSFDQYGVELGKKLLRHWED